MLNVDLIEKRFEQPILGPLNLSIAPGELVCIIGPTGCGKSSLLNIIAGLDTDYLGEVHFNGNASRLGYMFQEPRLLPWRTVRQNLMIVRNDEQKIDQLLTLTGLMDHQHKFPRNLSLGMARRVALARCLLVEPDIILMDEPLVSLDATTANLMRQTLKQLRQSVPHLSLVYVTHDLDEVLEMADRIIVLGDSPARITAERTLDNTSKVELSDLLRRG